MTIDHSRDIGRHDQAIETLQVDVRDMKASLVRIEAQMNRAQGGIRTLIAVSTASAAIASGVTALFSKLKGGL